MTSPNRFVALLLALAMVAAACGGETAVDVDLTVKPLVEIPDGDAPTELLAEDIVIGEGKAAASGDWLIMQYVGVLHDDGSQFDASWDRDTPFSFELGAGRVIQGWDEGIAGMTEGSRRQLTIPPAQAYGDNSPSADIPNGSTLVFVVDLIGAIAPHEFDFAVDNPDELAVTEIAAGDGVELVDGDVVEVVYSIATAGGDALVQSTWIDGRTGTFTIGADSPDVFPAWAESLVGQNVGDEVRIVVPPDSGPDPESGETFVTQVTVVGVIG